VKEPSVGSQARMLYSAVKAHVGREAAMKRKKAAIIGTVSGLSILILLVGAYVVLRTYTDHYLRAELVSAVKASTGRDLDMGRINVGIRPRPKVSIDKIRLKNSEWGSRPQLLSVKRIDIIVEWLPLLQGDIRIRRIILIEPRILLETNEKGRFNISFVSEEERGPEASEILSWVPQTLIMKNGIFTFKTFKKNGKGNPYRFRIKRLSAEASDAREQLSVEVEGDYKSKGFVLSGTSDLLKSLTDASDNTYDVRDLKMRVGESLLQGTLKINLSGGRPRISAKMTSPNLSLSSFVAESHSSKKDPAAESPHLFPDEPIPFALLDVVDADISFSADELQAPPWTARGVNMEATLKNGHLKAKPVHGHVAGGELNAVVDIQHQDKGAVVETTLNASHLSLSKMKSISAKSHMMEGRIDLHLDIKGEGDSVASLMSTLDGKAEIQMKDGRIANAYIEQLDALATDFSTGVFRMLNPKNKTTDETVINCFVCRFDIRKGMVKSRVMVFNTPDMVVLGDGEANLKTGALDFSFKPSPKEGIGIEGIGKINLSLKDLTQPFKLGGTLTHPSLSIDPAETALVIGEALGGAALFGPVGIAVVLLTGETNGEENPCLSAIEKAEKHESKATNAQKTSSNQDTDDASGKGTDQFVNELVNQNQ